MKNWEEIKKTPIKNLTPLEQFISLCYLGKDITVAYERSFVQKSPKFKFELEENAWKGLCSFLINHSYDIANDIEDFGLLRGFLKLMEGPVAAP